jgi:hypothetical protein
MAGTGTQTRTKSVSKKNGVSPVKGSVVIVLMVVVMVGYYYYLSNKEKQREPDTTKLSVAQELIARNLDTNYPPTPKEVVKYYSDITKCYYNEEYSSEELEQLAGKARELFDEELLEINEFGQYIIELNQEIDYYKENSIRIANYSVSAATDVDMFSQDGYNFARLYCTYTLTSGSKSQPVEEVFLLRKDEDGHWKIFGWDLAENVNLEE